MALRRKRRGRGGTLEKQFLKAQLLSPGALKSTRESTRKIVTVLFRNYALSGKDTIALFFVSQVEEMKCDEHSQRACGQTELSSPAHV